MENKEFFERETKGFSESEAGGDTWMSGALPTPSVQNAIERLQSLGGDVSAAAFAREVLKGHSDYAKGQAAALELKETPSRRPAHAWISEIQALFDWDRIQKVSMSEQPPDLHGRILIVGLCLLEPELRAQFESADVFSALIDELWQKPFEEILTERGLVLLSRPAGVPGEPSESVANWPDDPLSSPEEDLLGRNAFARFLDRRIRAVPSRSGAYAIHLYGPWGSGKTTLLNLLKRHLEQEDTEDRPEAQNGTSQGQGKEERKKNWQVVEYNAWRNQHIQPPWWSLMEQVFTTTRKSLSPWNRFREYWWRFNTGRLPYIAALIVLAWVLALIVFPLLRHQASGQGTLAYLAASSDNISKIIALVATIWGGIFAINRSLLLGAAQAAKRYSDLTHDPTSMIKRRFTELIHRTPKRVAVFIDDLDRCQSQFVVNLLEGIQTLFRDAPVVFVVSADRQWLNGCYEDVYEKLKPRVHEPGKPLGALFLEKAFRFATPMPGIPDELKKAFWEYLLDLKPSDWKSQIGIARETARSRLREAGSEEDVRRLVREHAEQPYPDQRAFREEAVVRLAAPEVIERMEHALHPYHVLLEPNPRAMKLLVNAYSANLALSMLSEVEIDRHQMALWTILGSRWPQLAEHLLKNPDLLDKLKNSDASNIPEAIKGLFESPVVDQVRQIVYGGEIGPELSVETIRHCKRICL